MSFFRRLMDSLTPSKAAIFCVTFYSGDSVFYRFYTVSSLTIATKDEATRLARRIGARLGYDDLEYCDARCEVFCGKE